jgi:hypothetical protein
MPLQETLDTFSYFISEADKLNLSFIELVRYSKNFDVEFDGKSTGNALPTISLICSYTKQVSPAQRSTTFSSPTGPTSTMLKSS